MRGKERRGKESTGEERRGKEKIGKERRGKERKNKERKGKARRGKERRGKEREGKERNGLSAFFETSCPVLWHKYFRYCPLERRKIIEKWLSSVVLWRTSWIICCCLSKDFAFSIVRVG